MDERDKKMSQLQKIAKQVADIELQLSNGQIEQDIAMDRLCQIACNLQMDELLLLDEIVQDILKNVDADENF